MYKAFVFIIFAIILVSCSDSMVNNSVPSGSDELQSATILPNPPGEMSSPTRTWIRGIRDCIAPKRDCFEEVIVEAPKDLYYNELDARISAQTTDEFFSETGNYAQIFNNFTGPALEDLRSGITTLSKIEFGNNLRTYYIHYIANPDSTPDYSIYY